MMLTVTNTNKGIGPKYPVSGHRLIIIGPLAFSTREEG
jgi:hypothetical protein